MMCVMILDTDNICCEFNNDKHNKILLFLYLCGIDCVYTNSNKANIYW